MKTNFKHFIAEAFGISQWRKPKREELLKLYQKLKTRDQAKWKHLYDRYGINTDFLNSREEFINLVLNTDPEKLLSHEMRFIKNLSKEKSIKDLKDLVKSYSNKDITWLVDSINNGDKLPTPILVKGDKGLLVLDGNLTINIANIQNVQVWGRIIGNVNENAI